MKGRIFDIQRFSLHDGPGIRTTVFLKGCPLRCAWCQNPEGIEVGPELLFTPAYCVRCGACAKACPHGVHRMENGVHVMDRSGCVVCGKCVAACLAGALEIVGREMAVAEALRIVAEDRVYYEKSGGGVTLSGGEPLAQARFAVGLLAACRKAGFHTAVDTALDVEWKAVEKALPHTDLFLVDLKHTDPVRHEQGTGRSNARVLSNLRELDRRGAALVVRVPVIPGFNDREEDIASIAAVAASLKNVRFVELLPFHKLGEPKWAGLGKVAPLSGANTLTREALERLARAAEVQGVQVKGRWKREARSGERGVRNGECGSGNGEWQERLEAIRERKRLHTVGKQKMGAQDRDDWGDIPLGDQVFAFRPETAHPKGYVLGPRDCGRNFRRFLEAVPTYVDRNSSLLGGYYVTFNQFVTGWDPENYWTDLAPEFRRYGIVHGIDNNQHFLPDVKIGLDMGFGGLLAKLAACRQVNTGADEQAYYDGLTDFVQGIQGWIRRHADAARAMATGETSVWAKENLRDMAAINDRLSEAPPGTFREACQWLAWYQMAKRMYIGGGSLGRLDLLLLPYYERDVKAGILDDDEATFHIACFLVKDSHYIQLGGMDAQGDDQTNRLSFLFLEAAHRVKVPANLAVAVHEKTDPELLRRATELLVVDRMGIPRFAGLTAVVDGMVKRGFPLEVARQRVQAGCNWFCVPGREYCFSDTIKINFARILEVALDDLECRTRDAERGTRHTPSSVQRLWKRFDTHLTRAVEVTARGIDFHIAHQHRYYPEFGLSVLCHGPVEKGVDASHGAVEFVNVGVDGAALATVADSFAAIEQRVEKEGSVTWSELSCALNQKWWRCGRIRALMESVPGYGRGGTRGDWWAERISRRFSELVVAKLTPGGHRMTPGLFSWASTISMGRDTGATPDGRGAGDPISFGANPNPGRLRGGSLVPTGLSTAIARVHPPYGNPAPLQFDVDPGLVSDEDGVEKFAAFIRAHFALGGTLINANILDRDKVLDACRNPAKYPDLVVRVTGFSVYFASLSDTFRKLVYDRVVAMEG
jgi:formate C-acetyltransferase